MNAINKVFFLVIVFLPLMAKSQCPSPATMDTVVTSILSYSPYTWDQTGKEYSTSASDTVINDCEMQVLHLTIYETQVLAKRIFACDSFYWHKSGQTYHSSGIYTHLEHTDKGGTLEHQLTLTIDNSYNSSDQASSCDSMAWHELELPIGSGEGRAVSIDGSGTLVAIGNYRYGTDAVGQVSVYKWSTLGWTQKGQTLEGDDPSGNFGYDISLSTNGKYLAVGSPRVGAPGSTRVYEWNGSSWEQRGSTIYGIAQFDELGSSLDLNNDGSVLAIGAASSNRVAFELGEVRVYQWDGTDWIQMGDHLYEYPNVNSPDNNGSSVALSGDGTRIIFGAPFAKYVNYFTYTSGGRYMVYDWDGSQWVQHKSFGGYRNNMNLGRSVSINEAGDIYAAGADGDRNMSGIIFSNRGVLGELHSKIEGERYGQSISFNQAGNIMAVSSPHNDETDLGSGMVQVFKWSGEKWGQIGQNLYGEVSLEQFGFDLQLNGDGRILIVGSSKGEYDDSPAKGTHVYYYGCAKPEQNCTASPCQTPIETTLEVVECEYYMFNGVVRYESGQYQEVFTSQAGCDSLVTLNLTIESGENYVQHVNTCQTYEFNGETLTTSGEYTALFTSSTGCDSLVTLNLVIGEPETFTHTVRTCGSYTFDGKTLTTSGTYQASFVNQNGCDSLVTLELEMVDTFDHTFDVTACSSYEFDGKILTEEGTYSARFNSQHGCDSLVTINLTFTQSKDTTYSVATCGSYEFFGTMLTESGSYTEMLSSSSGCDSLVTLDLTILATDDESCGEIVAGLDGDQKLAISVYPNPVQHQLIVDLGVVHRQVSLEISTLSGKILTTEQYQHVSYLKTALEAPAGLYLLRVTVDNLPSVIYKIHKQ